MLQDTAFHIRKLANRENLTSKEAKQAFDILTKEDTEGYHTIALLLGLHVKGETPEELYGIVKSIEGFGTKLHPNVSSEKIIDISGTGGDNLKTFNVSTTAAFVVASANVYVAKQAWRTFRGLTGSEDILREFGINVLELGRKPRKIETCLQKTGMTCYFYGYLTNAFENREKIGFKMAQLGITFPNPFSLVSFAYSAIDIKNRIYGVYNERYLMTLAELFQKLGYQRGMTVYGVDGLDELSNIGLTKICEFKEGKIKQYTFTPEDLGVKKANYNDIKGISKKQNIIDFLRVIYGTDKGPKRDIVAVNAGAALYIMGKVSTLKEGTELAVSLIDSGKASAKLEEVVSAIGNPDKLQKQKGL